jgi:hypothetical protein
MLIINTPAQVQEPFSTLQLLIQIQSVTSLGCTRHRLWPLIYWFSVSANGNTESKNSVKYMFVTIPAPR